MVTPAAPMTSQTFRVPAAALGPNSSTTPITPTAMAPSCRGLNRSCPAVTENTSRAIGVSAELITAARPAVIYFRP